MRRLFAATALLVLASAASAAADPTRVPPPAVQSPAQAAPVGGPITPINELETRMLAAVADPAARPAFEQAFLTQPVLLRIDAESYARLEAGRAADGTIQQSTQVNFWSEPVEGQVMVPVFSDASRLVAAYGPEALYMRVTGREALRMTAGHPLALNPGSPPTIVWSAQEAAILMNRPVDGR